MNRSLSLLALISVIVLAGCLGSSGQQSPQAAGNVDSGEGSPDAADTVSCDDVPGETHTVSYGKNGFSPSDLTVQRCDRVVWETTGPSMWVGSDVHPTHTEYDGTSTNEHCPNDGAAFDQCETGSSYAFTFTKTGEWGYHNHVRSAHGGTVVVEPR